MIKAEKLRTYKKCIFYLFCYFKNELFCTNCTPPESRVCGYQIHAKHTTKSYNIRRILYDYTSRIMITYVFKQHKRAYITFSSQIYIMMPQTISRLLFSLIFFSYTFANKHFSNFKQFIT